MAARSGDVGTRLRVVSLALTSSDRSKGRCDVQEMPPEVPKAQPKSRGSALTPRRLLLLGFLVLLVGFSTVAMRESLSDSVFPGDGITVTLVDESTVRESRELTYLVVGGLIGALGVGMLLVALAKLVGSEGEELGG